jgi:tetratricopeptide (TPR) repeat protein
MLGDARWAAEGLQALAPHAPESAVAHGLVHLIDDRLDEATEMLEEAVRRDPQCYDAWYALGRALFAGGRYQDAVAAYERAASVRIDDYQCLGLAMVACRSMGDEEQRLCIAQRLLPKLLRHRRLHPDDPRAGYFEASVHCVLGDGPSAVARLEHTIALGPNDPSILYNAACVYCLLGMKEEALDCLRRTASTGFADRHWMAHDMDLRDLHGDPRFEAILAQVEANRRTGLGES